METAGRKSIRLAVFPAKKRNKIVFDGLLCSGLFVNGRG
jgi:hypothetical protein